jgi:hypothetical protein
MAAYVYRGTCVASVILDTNVYPISIWSVVNIYGALNYSNTDRTID